MKKRITWYPDLPSQFRESASEDETRGKKEAFSGSQEIEPSYELCLQ
jgi:hypothetical protein